ncbi:hypothetical protein Ahy_A07g036148 isoform A [Arachis hypogaea]|uniref:uroporphyrinogen-III C-methyltransferase n=2 Tax=Arachis hypogaea TaxID=3818 RepID=A0A445CFD5_ARAHY|nr:hypothetical protein Ahy_A07g036148 isoform A [Arachis hypogaea]
MALHKFASFSSLHYSAFTTTHYHRVFSINCCTTSSTSSSSSSSSPSSSSPFTEKHSIERFQRDQWLYTNTATNNKPIVSSNLGSIREDDIALQLPELKKLLQVLREKRESEGKCSSEGKCVLGNVFLVGTGPGDPELLTLKAVRVIKGADLLLYDRLVSNDVLDLVAPHARLLYVGKTAGYHSRTQEEIHELLLSFAEAGATVVRLKGGDPLVFGRGGEEMDFLQQQGIQVKVIPGITAASGIAAELGIPLTHRGIANSVRFLTGHSRKGGTDPLFVAENAADPDSTLVVYMGLSTLPSLAQKLMCHGLSPETPAAAIERGTTPQQRTMLHPTYLRSVRKTEGTFREYYIRWFGVTNTDYNRKSGGAISVLANVYKRRIMFNAGMMDGVGNDAEKARRDAALLSQGSA